jgi:hypothetical protein
MDFPTGFFRRKKSQLRNSAKRRNKEFQLSSEFIKKLYSDVRCFYSGEELPIEEVSIDRLDCNEGYVESNIVIASLYVNNIKGRIEDGHFVSFEKLKQKVGERAAQKIIYHARLSEAKVV